MPTVGCKATNVVHLTERAAIKLLLTHTVGQFSAPLKGCKNWTIDTQGARVCVHTCVFGDKLKQINTSTMDVR